MFKKLMKPGSTVLHFTCGKYGEASCVSGPYGLWHEWCSGHWRVFPQFARWQGELARTFIWYGMFEMGAADADSSIASRLAAPTRVARSAMRRRALDPRIARIPPPVQNMHLPFPPQPAHAGRAARSRAAPRAGALQPKVLVTDF